MNYTNPVPHAHPSIHIHEPPGLMKVHGWLMTMAWLNLAGVAMIIARYYKGVWPHTQIFGKPVWFQLHRGIMMVVWLATIISIIVAYAYEGATNWETAVEVMQSLHLPCGTAASVIALIQPLLTIFRPPPESPKRFWFRLFHGFIGYFTWALANAAMYIAFGPGRNDDLNSTARDFTIYIVYVFWVIHGTTYITLETHKYYLETVNARQDDDKTPLKRIDYEKTEDLTFLDTITIDNGAVFLRACLILYIGAITALHFGYMLLLYYHQINQLDLGNITTMQHEVYREYNYHASTPKTIGSSL